MSQYNPNIHSSPHSQQGILPNHQQLDSSQRKQRSQLAHYLHPQRLNQQQPPQLLNNQPAIHQQRPHSPDPADQPGIDPDRAQTRQAGSPAERAGQWLQARGQAQTED